MAVVVVVVREKRTPLDAVVKPSSLSGSDGVMSHHYDTQPASVIRKSTDSYTAGYKKAGGALDDDLYGGEPR